MLLPLAGKPVLHHVIDRLRRVVTLADVVVATTDCPGDEPLRAYCRAEGIPYVAGSEDDVLDRYVQTARRFDADPIVRVTADCPLLDPAIVARAVDQFERAGGRLLYVGFDTSFPDGLDVEVIAREALETAWREARLPSEREHVTPFIWKQPDRFPQDRVRYHEDLSGERWTLDQPEDYEFLRAIYDALHRSGRSFGMQEVLQLLAEHPELAALNAGIVRNDGYLKSVREDNVGGRQGRED